MRCFGSPSAIALLGLSAPSLNNPFNNGRSIGAVRNSASPSAHLPCYGRGYSPDPSRPRRVTALAAMSNDNYEDKPEEYIPAVPEDVTAVPEDINAVPEDIKPTSFMEKENIETATAEETVHPPKELRTGAALIILKKRHALRHILENWPSEGDLTDSDLTDYRAVDELILDAHTSLNEFKAIVEWLVISKQQRGNFHHVHKLHMDALFQKYFLIRTGKLAYIKSPNSEEDLLKRFIDDNNVPGEFFARMLDLIALKKIPINDGGNALNAIYSSLFNGKVETKTLRAIFEMIANVGFDVENLRAWIRLAEPSAEV